MLLVDAEEARFAAKPLHLSLVWSVNLYPRSLCFHPFPATAGRFCVLEHIVCRQDRSRWGQATDATPEHPGEEPTGSASVNVTHAPGATQTRFERICGLSQA